MKSNKKFNNCMLDNLKKIDFKWILKTRFTRVLKKTNFWINPRPSNNGIYCSGERRKYRTCNTHVLFLISFT